jgi:hypothetical protein
MAVRVLKGVYGDAAMQGVGATESPMLCKILFFVGY